MVKEPKMTWNTICQKVSEIALPILPHISSNKLKSEIISNLFESQSAYYLNGIQAKSDREPDLIIDGKPLEIKVTNTKSNNIKKVKWMGGKYSKRTSDYILVMWNYNPTSNTLYGIESEGIKYNIIKTYIHEDDWSTVDNNRDNYYATIFDTNKVLNREYEILVGQYNGYEFILE